MHVKYEAVGIREPPSILMPENDPKESVIDGQGAIFAIFQLHSGGVMRILYA